MHDPSSSSTPHNPNDDRQGPIILNDPRLVRAAYDADGLSVFVPDEEIKPFRPFGPLNTGFS